MFLTFPVILIGLKMNHICATTQSSHNIIRKHFIFFYYETNSSILFLFRSFLDFLDQFTNIQKDKPNLSKSLQYGQ